ncbi:DNA repair protein Swi5/Sae3 [Kwoniella mangroviensis CBS 10435]|uniref:DNA repair protein Swi5/Sae3 n=1 Tax=Kwoniella mangroviensis CBS 10435 TaxID=1331196 RepID=A0A1B9J1J8_9TREE|nr:DNA repair protein Swi5/Sae3 [Kwoniella mangroviensis CBS 8507]OCF61666.1 DNA repair protein Swi5/Sae3 [Kwoniella mangroviensis CBS 10435]OCF67323.1 DNA repair protein Swi5/Sae3 [Kwoniella mangroviensis CBS 8507]
MSEPSPTPPSSTSTETHDTLTPTSPLSTNTANSKHAEHIRELQAELTVLKIELGDHNPQQIVQNHIKLLHEYNEIKDGTQALIGKYAQLTGRTVREIHQEMGLPLTD